MREGNWSFRSEKLPLPLGEGWGEGFRRLNIKPLLSLSAKGRGDNNNRNDRSQTISWWLSVRWFGGACRELRKKQTSAEALLWQLLRNRQLLGFKFRRQHQFGDYVADFYCHDAQLVIECDGSVHEPNEQWHHDRNRDAYMIAQGLRVLRFANDRILNDPEEVLGEIANHLASSIARRTREKSES